jgi:hypothetical protein
MPGVLWPSLLYYFAASAIGYSIGLLISTFLYDNRSIINILPLILIPQIIFGGAIIEYERMNKHLKIYPKSPIPEVVQIIPSRWLFEGLFTAQAQRNSYNRLLARQEKKRLTLESKFRRGLISETAYLQAVDETYLRKAIIAKRYPEEIFTNEYVNTAVDMMDGRFFNTFQNVFLSSHKKLFDHKFRTYHLNLMVIFCYILLFQMATLVKLRYFYKE